MSDLKPCPFCGGDAEIGHRTTYSVDSSFDFIGCKDCGAMMELENPSYDYVEGGWNSSRAETIAAWNRRHTSPEVQALRDDVTGWISNAQVAREKWSEYEARAEAAEAELATLRAQVERLRAAAEPLGAWLYAALDDTNPCVEMKRDINAWFAALTEGAAL